MNIILFGLKYLKKYKRLLLLIFVTTFIQVVISTILPYITGDFLDKLLKYKSIDYVIIYAAILVAITIVELLGTYVISLSNAKITSRSTFDLSFDTIFHLQHVPLSFYYDNDASYINQRINSDTGVVINFTLNTLIQVSNNVVGLAISLYLIFTINGNVCILLGFCVLAYTLQYIFMKDIIYKKTQLIQEQTSKFYSKLFDLLNNVKLIKIYVLFDKFAKNTKENFETLYRESISLQRIAFLYTGGGQLLVSISKSLLIIYGGIEFLKGEMTIGMLSIIISYFGMVLTYITYFVNLGQGYLKASVSYNRLKEYLSKREEFAGNAELHDVNFIHIQNLTFKYGNDVIFNNLSIDLKSNHIYGIIGPNGCGKSTFVDSLLGLNNDELVGDIIFNNEIDITNINLNHLRKSIIAYSSQKPLFLPGSLLSNLTLGCDHYDKSMLKELVKGFELDHENTLDGRVYSKNINTYGNNLSGGEMQKTSIIRTILSNKQILIFDEPTSFLDDTSRKYFKNIIKELKKDRIIILVTHDDDLMDVCDQKIFFNNTL